MTFPWPPLNTPPNAVEASLRRLGASLAVATGLATSGRAIDLFGLEAEAGILCARVLDLPPVEGLALRSALESLNASVNDLVVQLQAKTAPRAVQ